MLYWFTSQFAEVPQLPAVGD